MNFWSARIIMKMDYGLKPIWDALLGLYNDFELICRRHGFRYYFAYGSVLGAVRHRGFIPWDDDLDVFMPRQDYEEFLALPRSELPEWMRIDSIRTSPDYHRLFAKIVDTRQDKVAALQAKTGYLLAQGIFIDIFPLDSVGPKKPNLRWFILKRQLRWTLGIYRSPERPDIKHWPHFICGWLLSLFHPEVRTSADVLKYMDDWARRLPFSDETYTTFMFDMIPKFNSPGVFGTPRMVPFEKIEAPIPCRSDEYLALEYGDFMRLPPEVDRKPLHQKAMWAK